MTVLIWCGNDDEAWGQAQRDKMRRQYPDAHVMIRNPARYKPSDYEPAEIVCTRARWAAIIEAYRGRAELYIDGGMETEPVPAPEISPVIIREAERLTAMSIPALTDALSRVDDLGVLYLAYDMELNFESRRGALSVLSRAIRDAGGSLE